MSTGANCIIVEKRPGQWYLRVQQYPYGATTEYDERGPFSSKDGALKCLDRNFPNPGGFWVKHYDPANAERGGC
jgi:hypothetical protein